MKMIGYYLGPILGFAAAMILHMSMSWMGWTINLQLNPFVGGVIVGMIIGFIVYFMPETEAEKDDE